VRLIAFDQGSHRPRRPPAAPPHSESPSPDRLELHRGTFVETSTPAAVRSALAAAFPSFEKQYASVKEQIKLQSGRMVDNAALMSGSFAACKFSLSASDTAESEFPRVSSHRLEGWLRDVGAALDTRCVEWRGISDPELVRALVKQFDGEFVALVRRLRLDFLVDRLELARQLGD
jgi:hypothetical protein